MIDFVKKHHNTLFYSLLFTLVMLRYVVFDFNYYFQMDDYIQYHNYRTFGGGIWHVIEDMGMLRARPLAAIMDMGVWSLFNSFMIVAVAIISALYVWAVAMLKGVFQKYFGTGSMFCVILCLAPWLFEGVYWVSASSRICVGLFLAALSAHLFQRWIEKPNWWLLVGCFAAQLGGFCLYEQVLVFSITITFLLGIANFKRIKYRSLAVFFTAINCVIFLAITGSQEASMLYDRRMELLLPWQGEYVSQVLTPALRQMRVVFITAPLKIVYSGFLRGLGMLTVPSVLVSACGMVAGAFGLGFMYKKEQVEGKNIVLGIVTGALLALAPMTPFLVMPSPYITLRTSVLPLIGLVLVADLLWNYLVKSPTFRGVACTVVAVVFLIAAISETYDYRQVTRYDVSVAQAIIPYAENNNNKTAVIGIEPIGSLNYQHGEHISSAANSNWSLSGVVRALSKAKTTAFYITPISAKHPYMVWDKAEKNLAWFDDVYYFYQDKLYKIEAKQVGVDGFDLWYQEKKFGELREVDGGGVITYVK